ncbi:hypothetical protein [Flavobacterium sp. NKUCC04_CG]|uniref:hypothetical protein n=1 Tax=Flavobacterium sp. NKUCC04_CG TaxID=2842121 RepID=UPI001C5BCDEB|nr:hypothetical protein [Flavobacterium sp. NKUCC04_CG]MBW3519652.1 hypothetical protein [Flavobacterium sp. NKUCC04_CG]
MQTSSEKPPLNLVDIIIEIAGLLVIIIMWIGILINYNSLPELIPNKYSWSKGAMGMENRLFIIFMGALATIVFWGLSVLTTKPELFHANKSLSKPKLAVQLKIVMRMFRCLKLALSTVITMVIFQSMFLAQGKPEFLGSSFNWIAQALIGLPILFFIGQSFKNMWKTE